MLYFSFFFFFFRYARAKGARRVPRSALNHDDALGEMREGCEVFFFLKFIDRRSQRAQLPVKERASFLLDDIMINKYFYSLHARSLNEVHPPLPSLPPFLTAFCWEHEREGIAVRSLQGRAGVKFMDQ